MVARAGVILFPEAHADCKYSTVGISVTVGKLGKDSTMLDEKRRVTIGYVDDNNQRVEMKVPVDEFEIDEAGVDVVTSNLPKRRTQK
jgi:patatin-like phospholipase/acyl hydrolase